MRAKFLCILIDNLDFTVSTLTPLADNEALYSLSGYWLLLDIMIEISIVRWI